VCLGRLNTHSPCSLLETIVNAGDGFAPASSGDWYDWASATLLPAVLGGDGYVDSYNLVIGGIRLATTRSVVSSCSGLSGELG